MCQPSCVVWDEIYDIDIYWSYTLQTHWISRNVMRFFLPWLPFEVGFDQNGIIWENPRVRNVRSFFGRVAWFGWFYISFIVVHRCVAVLCFPQQNFPLWCRRQLAKRKESLDATWDHLTCWSQYVAINNYTILQAISLIVKGDWKIRSCGWGGVYRKLSEGFWSSLRGQGLGDERRRFGLSTAWPYGFASLAPQSLDDGKPIPGPCMEDFAGGMFLEKKDGSCQKHLKLSERRQKHLKSSKVVCLEATIATSLGSPNVSGLSSLVISALAMRELKSEVYAKNMVGVLKHGVASRALEETWHPKQLSKSHETSSRFWGMRELSKWWV